MVIQCLWIFSVKSLSVENHYSWHIIADRNTNEIPLPKQGVAQRTLFRIFIFIFLKYAGKIPQQTYTTTYYWQSVLCSFHCNFSPDKWSCITESRSFRYPQTWEVFVLFLVFFLFFCSVYSFDTKGIRYRSCPERLSNMENVFIFNVICFYSSDLPMEEQLRRLQEERTCKVCMDKEVNIVFIPCGHLVVCKECAPSLRKCPICRGMVKGTVRTFLS